MSESESVWRLNLRSGGGEGGLCTKIDMHRDRGTMATRGVAFYKMAELDPSLSL